MSGPIDNLTPKELDDVVVHNLLYGLSQVYGAMLQGRLETIGRLRTEAQVLLAAKQELQKMVFELEAQRDGKVSEIAALRAEVAELKRQANGVVTVPHQASNP